MPTPEKFADLRAAMTLTEKASLMSGDNFWNTKPLTRLGVPSIMLTDGPHGLRKQGGAADHLGLNASLPATCFPPAATLVNSWDPALLEQVGVALGTEAAAAQVSVLLPARAYLTTLSFLSAPSGKPQVRACPTGS